jgi:hypothetical protein
MSYIKTWVERCDEHPDHQSGMVSNGMIQARMQEEIDDLRAENERLREALGWYADPRNHFPVERRSPGDPDPAVVFAGETPIMSDGGERARNALEGKP